MKEQKKQHKKIDLIDMEIFILGVWKRTDTNQIQIHRESVFFCVCVCVYIMFCVNLFFFSLIF